MEQEMSNADMVVQLGQRFRQYRLRSGLTQGEASQESGVSVLTIHKFESGKVANMSLQTLFALLRVVGRIEEVEHLLPELPPDPERVYKQQKEKQRVKHGR